MIENIPLLAAFTHWDGLAAAYLAMAWVGMGWRLERGAVRGMTMAGIMHEYRAQWMHEMIFRDMRVFDASLLNSLQNGCGFFASAAMLAIGGMFALLGQADRLAMIAQDFALGASENRLAWEAKLLLPLGLFVFAFFKFAWAYRLFGYCAILMGALPNNSPQHPDEKAHEMARRAGELNMTAARSFNRGLRAIYFALAAFAWSLGPLALVLATTLVALTLDRREFRSHSYRIVSRDQPKQPSTKEE